MNILWTRIRFDFLKIIVIKVTYSESKSDSNFDINLVSNFVPTFSKSKSESEFECDFMNLSL